MSAADLVLPALRQAWPMPSQPRPIVLLGAGGIVNDAHLPAYRKAGLPVIGIYDKQPDQARTTAQRFAVPRVADSLQSAIALGVEHGAVFDLAVPPAVEFDVLSQLPPDSVVLMQKPMGSDLADARRIRDRCRTNRLRAAVNFQLRFAPMMLLAQDAIAHGLLGKLVDVEFHLNIRTPWELFPFLQGMPRCEILVHTVHHLDFCRALLGEPRGVYARTVKHPSFAHLASTKTAAILDYGENVRCVLSINHNYESGPHDECADVRIQGTHGAIRVSMGLLMNYPAGKPETVSIATRNMEWTNVPVTGTWFPDGFIGTMCNLQRFAAGEDPKLVSHYEDAYRTMALVEACYQSNAAGGTPIPD